MGSTKYEVYSQQAIEIAELFKALAHPARITIILKLLEQDASMNTMTDLLSQIDISQSSMSKHVEKLKSNGFITSKLETRGMKCYQVLGVNKETLKVIKKIVAKKLNSTEITNIGSHYLYPNHSNWNWDFLQINTKT